MELWRRARADLARPEAPTGRDEAWFHVVAPLVIIVVAQLTDPGPPVDLLALVPAAFAFLARVAIPRVPAEVFAAVVLGSVAVAIGRDGNVEGAFFLSVTAVLYTSWTLRSRLRAVLIVVAAVVVTWVVAERLAPQEQMSWHPWAVAHLFTFLLGRTLLRQRELIDQLEAARQALAEQAVAEERRRIARELHDLAGHSLAAVLLHVTGARHVLHRDPAEAEEALRDAEAVGRSAMDQIRGVVGALRADERGTDRPLPGAGDLSTLLTEYRRAGLDITERLDPAAGALDGPAGTALHRIAGEALANVARHAPANAVEVALSADGTEVVLTVTDHGRPAAPRPAAGAGAHFGLVGMEERARALGGSVTAGPTADGWRVQARLPAQPGPRPGARREAAR